MSLWKYYIQHCPLCAHTNHISGRVIFLQYSANVGITVLYSKRGFLNYETPRTSGSGRCRTRYSVRHDLQRVASATSPVLDLTRKERLSQEGRHGVPPAKTQDKMHRMHRQTHTMHSGVQILATVTICIFNVSVTYMF